MAKVKSKPSFLTAMRKSIVDVLKASGIAATVQISPVPTTKLYRVAVLAQKFSAMKHSERQDLVWRIVGRTLSPDEQMRISMILTLTPKEATGK